MNKLIRNKFVLFVAIIVMFIFVTSLIFLDAKETIITSSDAISTKKIEWGIKRNDNHNQPDLGSRNRETLKKYKGIAMGNNKNKKVYLTFDEGYEAGYTPKILEVLKQNNVKATFFITAHFFNTQEELVNQMIKEGHIVGNHTPKFLMSINYKIIKC